MAQHILKFIIDLELFLRSTFNEIYFQRTFEAIYFQRDLLSMISTFNERSVCLSQHPLAGGGEHSDVLEHGYVFFSCIAPETKKDTHTHTHMYVYIYKYIYIYVCVCMHIYIYIYIHIARFVVLPDGSVRSVCAVGCTWLM